MNDALYNQLVAALPNTPEKEAYLTAVAAADQFIIGSAEWNVAQDVAQAAWMRMSQAERDAFDQCAYRAGAKWRRPQGE